MPLEVASTAPIRQPLANCVISNNSAGAGGGWVLARFIAACWSATAPAVAALVYVSTLDNCTLTGNSSGTFGAADACHLQNSIIYYNANGLYADCYQCQLSNCCTTIGLGTSTLPSGCFSNAPSFVNAAAGDYHLNPWSLCVDAGNNSFTTNSLDLNGNPRIAGAAVDMGAYENQSPFQVTPHYVSLFSTNPVPPYTNWSTAATNIQDAVGVAQAGEFVIVGDGTYTNGGTVLFGSETNRVALTNAITLTSAGGPQAAKIVGGTQMRCVYVGTNSTLIGFTITGGRGRSGGDITNEQSGAGIWCEIGGTVSNCIVVGNFNSGGGPIGGGIFRGAVYNSTIYSNSAAMGAGGALGSYFNCLIVSNAVGFGNFGGGIYGGIASNCTLLANGSYYGVTGGGAYRSTLYNCTLATNFSTYGGGGADSSTLYHCILIGNQSTSEGGGSHLSTNYNCTFVNNSAANGGAVGRGVSYGCLLSNNVAYFGGGGAFQATLTNCVLVGNQTTNTMPFYGGGGTDGGTLFNCLLLSNSAAYYGGGAYQGTLYNCTVVGNTATNSGGTYDSEVYNSIIYYNFATSASNYSGINLQYCCTTPQPFGRSTCFTNAPLFVDLAKIDFHLQSNSPCINSGNNVYITNTVKLATDLDGNPRLISTAVDDGAYEFTSPASMLPYSWLWLYGLATDGSADNSDSDGDGMSNYAEWRAGTNPTNVASAVALKSPVVTETNATITWQSVSGVYYYVQRTPDFFAQPFQTIASNIVGPTGTISYTDTNAVAGSVLFYRVGVQ